MCLESDSETMCTGQNKPQTQTQSHPPLSDSDSSTLFGPVFVRPSQIHPPFQPTLISLRLKSRVIRPSPFQPTLISLRLRLRFRVIRPSPFQTTLSVLYCLTDKARGPKSKHRSLAGTERKVLRVQDIRSIDGGCTLNIAFRFGAYVMTVTCCCHSVARILCACIYYVCMPRL